jgi:putative tryptophan/tyrosine transport system substrate-binding protein
MRRRHFITLLGGAAASPVLWPLAAGAQRADRMRRVGMLIVIPENDLESQLRMAAFQAGLRELGWMEGSNVRIDYRSTAGDVAHIKPLAAELVGSKPDVIVCNNTPVLEALRGETRTIPIVFTMVADAIGGGFAASLARPGGNITGFTSYEFSMAGKWLELLKELAPGITRAALLFNPDAAPFARSILSVAAPAARSLSIQPIEAPVRNLAELERSVVAFAAQPNGGLVILPDAYWTAHRELIIGLASRHRLPAVYAFRYYAASGGLASYGADSIDLHRRAASYVDRILKGASPADLPIQQPIKFELAINLKTAKALGLDVPPTLLARADEVIE